MGLRPSALAAFTLKTPRLSFMDDAGKTTIYDGKGVGS